MSVLQDVSETGAAADHLSLVVVSGRVVAERVLEVVLASPDGQPLPDWEPGAHVEVRLPSGLTRQYSLCGRPQDGGTWTIAVLQEQDGRGGSVELHRVASAGASLGLREPRNDFPLEDAPSYLFLAGGIGVTPILTMVEHVAATGTPWTLVYGGRSRGTMAYLDRLAACSGGDLQVWPEDERGRPDLGALIAAQPLSAGVYACGPAGMLDAVMAAHRESGAGRTLHVERFGASGPLDLTGGAFEVELAKSGRTLLVAEGESVLATVRAVLPKLSYSCEEGYCGECETKVLAGVPDHRDDFLDDDEQASNAVMMICVSRCKGTKLVLDL